MKRDTLALLLLLSFPAAGILVAWVTVAVMRRAGTFRCPLCNRRIAKTEILVTGVRCPNCDWAVETEPSRGSLTEDGQDQASWQQ